MGFRVIILSIAFTSLITACNNNTDAKVELKEIKQDSATKGIEPPPPPPPLDPPPDIVIKNAETVCYFSKELNTTITLVSGEKEVMGIIETVEPGFDRKNKTAFQGFREVEKLLIEYNGPAPVINSSLEFSSAPWTIKKRGKLKNLDVPLRIKNHDIGQYYLFIEKQCAEERIED